MQPGTLRILLVALVFAPTSVMAAKQYTCQDEDGELYQQYMPCPEGYEPDRAPAPTDRQSAKREASADPCRQDQVCWGKKHRARATYDCKDTIASLARYDHEWTDGWTEFVLERVRWADQERGIVRYEGDKLKLQNGFGAWQPHQYWCEWDTLNDRVVDAGASPAR